MRQVFIEFPWVHAPAPREFYALFQKLGDFKKLSPGEAINNGGTDGEVAFLLDGLCAFRTGDDHQSCHYITLVTPGRLIGNVDGVTGTVVNITDIALRSSEALVISRHSFRKLLSQNPALYDKLTESIIQEHESDMEGMFSVMTDSLETRIIKLFGALIFRDAPRNLFHWTRALSQFQETPVPYALTVSEIARTVGASRTATSLVLTEWERKGLLRRNAQERIITAELLRQVTDWLA